MWVLCLAVSTYVRGTAYPNTDSDKEETSSNTALQSIPVSSSDTAIVVKQACVTLSDLEWTELTKWETFKNCM